LVEERRIRRQNNRKLDVTERLTKKLVRYDNQSGKLATKRDVSVLVDDVFEGCSALTGQPIGSHYDMALVALESSKPVALENAMLVNADEAKKLRVKRFLENDLRGEAASAEI
jgi:hypothetical protein